MIINIISWIIFGFVAGVIAKKIMPGEENMGFWKTSILGILGSILGGFIVTTLGFGEVDKWNIYSFVVSVLGALATLFIYAKYQQK